MFESARFTVPALALLLACGCARAPDGHADTASAAGQQGALSPGAARMATIQAAPASRRSFAALPDRGELMHYQADDSIQEGAYTWHRADVSEAHALHAIANGHLRVVTPSGEALDFAYDRHVEHDSGDWTWEGHVDGHPEQQATLTFGEHAAFGSIAQPDAPPLRLTVRNGGSWLVETDPRKVALLDTPGNRPRRPDYRVPPKPPVSANAGADEGMTAAAAPAMAAATTSGATTVDLVLGYTPGLATDYNGNSGAVTRLNYLVDLTNAIYRNSRLNAVVRLVATVPVSYPDATSNDATLEALTGYDSTANQWVTPAAAFNGLRAARETYGADLVAFVRSYRDPENDGCGIGWLIGGGQSGITQSDADYAYTVVSDGDDGGYYCLDQTLAHEMGHNMGGQHDVQTAKGDDGTLSADEFGAYAYSFGFKNDTAGFYTVMAYGDRGQILYNTFSSPTSTFCGGRACGTSQADNARTLAQTIPLVATFRATKVAASKRVLLRQLDTNGNGRSDLVLFNHATNRLDTWFMSGTTRQAYNSNSVSGALALVDAADFNGDGRTDLLFENGGQHQLVIGMSTGARYELHVLPYAYPASQSAIAAADVNGNGAADILLRDGTTGRLTTWYMSGTTRLAYNAHDINPSYEFVARGDLNHDRRQDLLWTNSSHDLLLSTSTGTNFTQQLLGLRYASTYQVAGLQDINGNGKADIVLTRNDHKYLIVWYMDGASRVAYNGHATDPAYRLVARADMDGNGRGDLVLSNPSTHRIKVMFSAGTSFSTALLPYVPGSGFRLMDVLQ